MLDVLNFPHPSSVWEERGYFLLSQTHHNRCARKALTQMPQAHLSQGRLNVGGTEVWTGMAWLGCNMWEVGRLREVIIHGLNLNVD